MNMITYFVLCALLSVCLCSAITMNDIQLLNANTFFDGWSKFLDQVIDAKSTILSPENESLYQAFIKRGTELNISKASGNKNAIAGMRKEMDGVKIRIEDEKKFFNEWAQFQTTLMGPISPEQEKSYASFIERAKSLNIKKSAIEEMTKQVNAIRDKFGKMVVPLMAPESESMSSQLEPKEESKAASTAEPKEESTAEPKAASQPAAAPMEKVSSGQTAAEKEVLSK